MGTSLNIWPKALHGALQLTRADMPHVPLSILTHFAVLRIVRAAAKKRGHLALRDGSGLRCCRCGATGAIDYDELSATGELVRQKCEAAA